jgi:CheY-like chemotaxis protein
MKPIDILLIEDNDGDILLFKESFEDAGVLVNIHVLTDGKMAIDYFQNLASNPQLSRPDYIFLDINLPKKKWTRSFGCIKKYPWLGRYFSSYVIHFLLA